MALNAFISDSLNGGCTGGCGSIRKFGGAGGGSAIEDIFGLATVLSSGALIGTAEGNPSDVSSNGGMEITVVSARGSVRRCIDDDPDERDPRGAR